MTLGRLVLAVAVLVGVATAAGIPAPASRSGQLTGDEPQYALTALSLWEDGDLDISNQRAQGAYRPFHQPPLPVQTRLLADGSRISPHNPLLPLLLAAPMGLGGWVAAKATLALLAGVLAGVAVWVAVRRLAVPPLPAAVVVTGLSLAPPLAVYATQVYPELPAALLVTVGLACLLGPMGRAGSWGVGLVVAALPWLAVKYLPVAVVLAGAALLRVPASRRWVLAVGWGLAGLAYVVGHLTLYGGLTPYATGDHFVGGELTVIGTAPNYLGRSTRLLGLLTDAQFGLAAWQPAYLLVPVALGWAWRRRLFSGGVLTALAGAGWITATFLALTMHGWWFPGRQVVVILPALVLLVAAWVGRSARRLLAFTLAALPGVVAFAWLAVEGWSRSITWVVDFFSTSNPLYRGWALLLPSYWRPDTATWAAHAVWLAVVAGLACWGWRGAASARSWQPEQSALGVPNSTTGVVEIRIRAWRRR